MTSSDVLMHTLKDLDPALDAAIDQAIRAAAVFPGKGVLVTRHDYDSYTINLTKNVPFGTTRELDLL